MADTQAECNARNKELYEMKASHLDYEKQLHENSTTQVVLSANLRKYRGRVENLEKREKTTAADHKLAINKL